MQTLERLAEIIKAQLIGDPQAVVRRAQSFEQAEAGDISFAADARYRARINECRATAIIVNSPVEGATANLLVARSPKLAFAQVIQALHAVAYVPLGVSPDLIAGDGTAFGKDLSIHPRVTIGKRCRIGNRVTLYPGVVIGDDCRIGDDSVIYANVAIYAGTEIGSRVTIHAGAVIGADGFGFVPDEEGRQVRLLQLGRVRIEDDCEIGANCAIDRGGFADTVLRRGVKLDNLIQVGHNCEIGEDTVIAAQAGFSGGTKIGKRCVIAGQVGSVEHVTVGDGAVLMARAVVTKDVKAGALMGGMIPALEYNAWRRRHALYSRLPELADRVKQLEQVIRDAGITTRTQPDESLE
ncbi:MAG: UDP-3-O-(3-hydroxymyristoyl)glucosamine N-acyltransferase [Blastocatellia bacterium]